MSPSGRELWKRNIQLLVPFLLKPRIQLKSLVSLEARRPIVFWKASGNAGAGPVQLYSEWVLTCYIALPWRPYVNLNGSTTFTLNKEKNKVNAPSPIVP